MFYDISQEIARVNAAYFEINAPARQHPNRNGGHPAKGSTEATRAQAAAGRERQLQEDDS